MAQRWSIQRAEELFRSRGCELMETEYVNDSTKMRYIAMCGHEHSITLNNFSQGKGNLCEACRRKDNGLKERVGAKKITAFFEAEGCQVIAPADKVSEKVRYIAHCGHVNEMDYNHFRQGGGRICGVCSKSVRYQIDYVRERFEEEGCELLEEEYINCKTPMRYLAQCGHESEISFDVFSKCTQCI